MWSKTRKALYERTAQCLKHRINYEFYMKQKSYIDRALFISIDKKRRFATTPGCWDWSMSFEREMCRALNLPHVYAYRQVSELATLLAMKYTGEAEINFVMRSIHLYLNVYSFKESLSSDNYFIYLLALLDRRLGKRRLNKIYSNIDKEPQWIRPFILLRAEGEGILNTI